MLLSTGTSSFLGHLKSRFHLADSDLPQPGEWANAGNTAGMLALRMDLLNVEQIDEILDVQENLEIDGLSFQEKKEKGYLFGQLAVRLGFMTEEEVELLLELQQLSHCLELGGKLLFTGKTRPRELVQCLGEFLDQ
jgi:hypothetical protein